MYKKKKNRSRQTQLEEGLAYSSEALHGGTLLQVMQWTADQPQASMGATC